MVLRCLTGESALQALSSELLNPKSQSALSGVAPSGCGSASWHHSVLACNKKVACPIQAISII